MKKILLVVVLAFTVGHASAQNLNFDSLKRVLAKKASDDTTRVGIIAKLMDGYVEYKPDSSIYYSKQGIEWAAKHNNTKLLAASRGYLSYALYVKGDYAGALDEALPTLSYYETSKSLRLLANTYNLIGNVYKGQENYPKAEIYYRNCLQTAIAGKDTIDMMYAAMNLAEVFERTNILDSALYYVPKAVAYSHANQNRYLDFILDIWGEVYLKLKNYEKAISYLHQSYTMSEKTHNIRDRSFSCVSLSKYYSAVNNTDSAIYWAKRGLENGRITSANKTIYQSADLLSALYESRHQTDSAFKYLKLSSSTNDSLYSTAKFQAIDALNSGEERRNAEIRNDKAAYQTNLKMYLLLFVLAIVLTVAFLLWRNSRNRQRALDLVKEQKKQTDIQKNAAEQALYQLKQMQNQLIQAEKMASLGELTAGIAHEIQNPLNFVNNFSEVNKEMLEELKAESEKPKAERDDKLETELINDLIDNEVKINHHGKRADSIVKGMLQHSRTGSGTKEPTNINLLAEEYLRLSYHGLRSKDKEFNAELITRFDADLPMVNIIPQDIGRVMLNLFNNAFYAVNQKAKIIGVGYKPEVTVTTAAQHPTDGGGVKGIIITVRDNGIGIPDAIKEKIMQPFFTTKPPGEGTGLGLSLTYDIVVKGHGGSIQVESKEGEGSEFVITLPVQV